MSDYYDKYDDEYDDWDDDWDEQGGETPSRQWYNDTVTCDYIDLADYDEIIGVTFRDCTITDSRPYSKKKLSHITLCDITCERCDINDLVLMHSVADDSINDITLRDCDVYTSIIDTVTFYHLRCDNTRVERTVLRDINSYYATLTDVTIDGAQYTPPEKTVHTTVRVA